MPDVTVLMPVYNAEKYLKESIESILNQTYHDFVFLIINDGSVDNSESIIQSYKDDRIQYVKNDVNLGLIKTLNKGIGIAKTKYICRMDADDFCVRNRIELLYDYMEKHPEIGVCSSHIKLFGDENHEIIYEVENDKIISQLIFGSSIAHAAAMIRKSVLENNNIYYNISFPHQEDVILWHDLKWVTKFSNIDEVLYYYRREGQNITIKNKKTKNNRDYNVFKYILSELGEYSEIEFKSHLFLFNPKLHDLKDVKFKEIKKWVNKLIKKNNIQKVYPIKDFKKVVNKKWEALFFILTDQNLTNSFKFWYISRRIKYSEFRYFISSLLKRRKNA